MCNFFSAIGLRNGDILWHWALDSHSDLLEYFKIDDINDYQSRFVKLELTPSDDAWLYPDKWAFKVDEPTSPVWVTDDVREEFRRRMVATAKNFIRIDGELKLMADGCWILGGVAKVKRACAGRIVRMLGSSKVGEMLESSSVGEMLESSKVGEMWGSSKVGEMRESSNVGKMWESSKVGAMLGSSHVGVMRGSSKVGEMLGLSKVGEMRELSKVGEMLESSNVGKMWESSKVGAMLGSSHVGVMLGSSNVGVMRESSNVGKMWESSKIPAGKTPNVDYRKVESST